MRLYRSTTFRAFIFVLLITSDSHAVCFEKAGNGVKVDGDCQSEKTTLFIKSEALTVKFSSGLVAKEVLSTMGLKIDGCNVSAGLTMFSDGSASMMVNKKTFGFPVTVTILKGSIKFEAAGSYPYTHPCKPIFKSVPGGHAIDVETSFKTLIPTFQITFESSEVYKPIKPALSPLEMFLIVFGVLLGLLLIGVALSMFAYVTRYHRSIEPSAVNSMFKPYVRPKAKTIDETVEDQEDDDPAEEREQPDKSLKLVTAVYRPTAKRRPDIENWLKRSRGMTTAETTEEAIKTAIGDYEVPEWVLNKYIKSDEFRILRGILTFNDAERRVCLYFCELSAYLFDACNKILKRVGRGWALKREVKEFRKELMRIRSLAAEVYLFTVEKHDAANLPWALKSLSELGQLNENVINLAFNNEPPTFEQITFIRKAYREMVKSEGQPGGVKLSKSEKKSIEYFIKMARDHEHVRRYYQPDAFLEMLERIEQTFNEQKLRQH